MSTQPACRYVKCLCRPRVQVALLKTQILKNRQKMTNNTFVSVYSQQTRPDDVFF